MVSLSNGTLHQTLVSAYERLTHDQLQLFASLRALPAAPATDAAALAARLADDDLARFCPAPAAAVPSAESSAEQLKAVAAPPRRVAELPLELVAEIVDQVGDWELAKAVGLPTALPRPVEWEPALGRVSATDAAILAEPLPAVRAVLAADAQGPTKRGTALAVRFGRVAVLAHLRAHARAAFARDFGARAEHLPALASAYGRVEVLDWWRKLGAPAYDCEPVDGASRAGHVHVLQWWLDSGLRVEYSDAALEHASAQGHLAVLNWWKRHRDRLPLKIGRAADMASAAGRTDALDWWLRSGLELKYDKLALAHASTAGRVDVLQWWARSGLQLLFDQDALTGATKHGRTEVLDWWDRSGLPIQYRICDIEEALEDAIGNGDEVRRWWARKGVNFQTNDAEWMKLQPLN